ncbi:MAG TPA: hypothetical protein VIM60_06985, partial [Edaphobacter sp.]
MTPPDTPAMLQPFALRAFTALYQLQPSWAGCLVLSLGLDERGAALAVATHIAGGVSLAVDDDPARLREVVRNGMADFVVNTLDEALRAIKNELRKGAPLSVALKSDPDAALKEMLERGLAPHVFSRFGGLGNDELLERASEEFASLDARLIDFESSYLPVTQSYLALKADEIISPLLEGEGWSLVTCQVGSPADLRDLDRRATDLLPQEDHLRRRWLESVPRMLQRQKPPQRSLWL